MGARSRIAMHSVLALGAVAVGVVFVLASCSTAASSGGVSSDRTFPIERAAGTSWWVEVLHPRFAHHDECDSDPAVDTAVMSADLPSSNLTLMLKDGSTDEDAIRIATCLDDALSSGTIGITGPLTE